METPAPANKASKLIKIEKDGKSYELNLLCDDKNIIIKCLKFKPLKLYEKKFEKKDLEKICKIFKAYDTIEEAYCCIINSIENKNYIIDINDEVIKIKLNDISTFKFKELIIPEKEVEISEKIKNLYYINENLEKEVNMLKSQNEKLQKEINSLKENQVEDLKINLIQGTNYNSGYHQFKVYKLNNNLIKLSGLINCTYDYNKPICQLPENCRPKGTLIFTTMKNGNTLVRVDIKSDGNVCVDTTGSGWLSLDGISFIAGL